MQDSFSYNETTFSAGTDLIISLVALLTVLLAANQMELQRYKNEAKEKEILFEKIEKTQIEIINSFAIKFNTKAFLIGENQWGISLSNNNETKTSDIKFYNDAATQRIVFGTNILFDKNSAILKKDGKSYIHTVSEILEGYKEEVLEIRILGHADNTLLSAKLKNLNLNLASQRAISVYTYFRDEGKLNPAEQIISATTYAEYMPVDRNYQDKEYSIKRLQADNFSNEQKANNRRIEIVLHFYQ